jgi:hypothetical protein
LIGSRWRCASVALAAFGMGVLVATAAGWLRRPPAPPAAAVAPLDDSARLREENATLRQLQLVDREAQAVLRRQLAELVAQSGELRRRLRVLRAALAPDGQPPDLAVGDLQLQARGADAPVAYRLLLVGSPLPGGRKLLGWVELWGVGDLDGRAHEVRLARLPLSVERLQALSGNVTLPAGFRPARLRVLLAPRGQPALPFEFAWQELLAAESPLPAETSLP